MHGYSYGAGGMPPSDLSSSLDATSYWPTFAPTTTEFSGFQSTMQHSPYAHPAAIAPLHGYQQQELGAGLYHF
jgi:hypothetical protein